jgi:hypothetical protein
MAVPTSGSQLTDYLPGIQRAVFETLWLAVPELESIFVRELPQVTSVYCRLTPPLSDEDVDTCQQVLGEIFAEVPVRVSRIEVKCGVDAPEQGFRELMSKAIFVAIAREVAPWRLEAGH